MPFWMTSPAWPLVCEDGTHLNRIVQSYRLVRPHLEKGPDVLSDVFVGKPKFLFLSLEIHGGVPEPFKSKKRRAFCLKNGCNECL